MTIVSLDSNKEEYVFNIKNHSGSERNENGYDLVCCSCSILLFTLIDSLNNITNLEEVEKEVEETKEPNITIKCKKNDKNKVIIDTVLNGYRLLQKNYQKNVKVLSKISE